MARKGSKRDPPPSTPEAREKQLIAMAYDLAEDRIREGTASSQLITHFLKLGTEKAKLEKEILVAQEALMRAKTESLESQRNAEELFKQAMDAFREYSGEEDYESPNLY